MLDKVQVLLQDAVGRWPRLIAPCLDQHRVGMPDPSPVPERGGNLFTPKAAQDNFAATLVLSAFSSARGASCNVAPAAAEAAGAAAGLVVDRERWPLLDVVMESRESRRAQPPTRLSAPIEVEDDGEDDGDEEDVVGVEKAGPPAAAARGAAAGATALGAKPSGAAAAARGAAPTAAPSRAKNGKGDTRQAKRAKKAKEQRQKEEAEEPEAAAGPERAQKEALDGRLRAFRAGLADEGWRIVEEEKAQREGEELEQALERHPWEPSTITPAPSAAPRISAAHAAALAAASAPPLAPLGPFVAAPPSSGDAAAGSAGVDAGSTLPPTGPSSATATALVATAAALVADQEPLDAGAPPPPSTSAPPPPRAAAPPPSAGAPPAYAAGQEPLDAGALPPPSAGAPPASAAGQPAQVPEVPAHDGVPSVPTSSTQPAAAPVDASLPHAGDAPRPAPSAAGARATSGKRTARSAQEAAASVPPQQTRKSARTTKPKVKGD